MSPLFKKECGTTRTLPKGSHPPKASDQVKSGLITEATKLNSQYNATTAVHHCGDGMMSQGDKRQQQDIKYTNDDTYSMCFLLPLARGRLITVSQCLSTTLLILYALHIKLSLILKIR